MTLQELRDKANAKLADLWPILQAKEEAYFTKHGQYFGLRWSPNADVVDGIDTAFAPEYPSRAIQKLDVVFAAVDVPFRMLIERINQTAPNNTAPFGEPPVYGPTAESYRVWVSVTLPNGDTYQRSRTRDGIDSGWLQAFKKPPIYELDEVAQPFIPPENPFPPSA